MHIVSFSTNQHEKMDRSDESYIASDISYSPTISSMLFFHTVYETKKKMLERLKLDPVP